jgi:hypothetical protein
VPKTSAPRTHAHHYSPNNLEPAEVDTEGLARQSIHEEGDANAAYVRLSKEEQSRCSPGESTLHEDTAETWQRGTTTEKQQESMATTMRNIRGN